MLLEINNLQKSYTDFRLDCSLKIKKGFVTGIIGANGAGKTTIFKSILGLIKPEDGSIKIFGKDQAQMTREDKYEIGTVMAENGFSSMLKVNDVIAIMKAMYPRFDERLFRERCKKYEIPLDKKIKDFSTGMKGKLKILLAISYEASLLVLDEPTVGLDYMTRNEILDELRCYMAENRGILVSSHISSDLEGICDDLYFLHEGKIKLYEETDRIVSEYGVLKLNREQYERIDKKHLLYVIEHSFCIEALTNQKQYYAENYPEIIIDRGCIDGVMTFLTKGATV